MKASYLCEWQEWQRKRRKGKREKRGMGESSASLFTLQERSQRGGEGMQSLAQPAWQDTPLNILISPLISTWKYLVLGGECEKPEIMNIHTPHHYHSFHLCWLCCSNSSIERQRRWQSMSVEANRCLATCIGLIVFYKRETIIKMLHMCH